MLNSAKVIWPWKDLNRRHEQNNAYVKADGETTIYDENACVQQTLHSSI